MPADFATMLWVKWEMFVRLISLKYCMLCQYVADCVDIFLNKPVPLKSKPYGAIQTCLLLLKLHDCISDCEQPSRVPLVL